MINKKVFIGILFLFIGYASFAANWLVSKNGGDRSIANTLPWAIDKANASATNDVIIINTNGPIRHTGPNTSTLPWNGADNGPRHQWTITNDAGSLTIRAGAGFTPILDGSLLNDARLNQQWKTHILAITGPSANVASPQIIIDGITFINAPNNDGNGGSGLILSTSWPNNYAAENVTIRNCVFRYNAGPGMQSYTTGDKFNNIVIEDCEFHDNGKSGIVYSGVYSFEIRRSKFYENGESGIQMQTDSRNGTIDEVECYHNGVPTLTSNKSGNNGAGIRFFNNGGANATICQDIVVSNSLIYENNIHGVEIPSRADRISIVNNQIYKNGQHPGGNGNQAAGIVYQFGGSIDNTVSGNNIYDNGDPGIYMYKFAANNDHSGNVFYNNTITNNGGGIVILSSVGSYIIGNTIDNTVGSQAFLPGGGNGIYFGNGCDDGVVYDNEIKNTKNSGVGIFITDIGIEVGAGANTVSGSNNVTVMGNYVGIDKSNIPQSNTGVGIRIERSDNSKIGVNPSIPALSRPIPGFPTINIMFPTSQLSLRNYISNCGDNGIEVDEGKGNEISNNFIGVDKTGSLIMANNGDGINIIKSTDIKIGVSGRNVISGNVGDGIDLSDLPLSTVASIIDNYIGLDSTGLSDFGNGANGILLQDCQSIDITSNIISGNTLDGVKIGGSTAAGLVESIKMTRNYIGLDKNGALIIANDKNGINVDNGDFVFIGDGTFANRNVVSGNAEDGILIQGTASNVQVLLNFIGFNKDGVSDKGNGGVGINMFKANTNVLVGNFIGFNGSHGISITDAATNNNTVQSNVVGVAYNGIATPVGNASNNGDGIHMENCINNQIGGSNVGVTLGNIIGYNEAHGINVGDESEANKVFGNYVGINLDDSDIGNKLNGVILDGTSFSNEIGKDWRSTALTGNFISFNGLNGILIEANSKNSTDNSIRGNTIGITTDQSSDAANGLDGVQINGGSFNTIGGSRPAGQMNFIAGSHRYQVHLHSGASNNKVFGNSIGNNSHPTIVGAPTSFLALNNSVYLTDANTSNNQIGGFNLDIGGNPKLINGNVIAQNASPAAVVIENGANNNEVNSNFIGMQEDGKTPFGNLELAIVVQNGTAAKPGSHSNKIGGFNKGNLIGQTVQGTNATLGNNDAIQIINSDDNSVDYNMIGVEFDKSTSVVGSGIDGKGIKVSSSDRTKVNYNIVGNVQNINNAIDVFNSESSEITYNQVGVGLDSTTVLPNTFNGIYVEESNNSIVKYNYVTNSDKHGIVDTNSTQTTLTHNEAFRNDFNGIYVSLAQISQLDSNIAYENTHNGILIDNGSNNTRTNHNSAKNNTLHGIHVTASTNVIMTSDTAEANTLNGFRIDKISDGITINTAVSKENKINGVHISESTGGTVSNSLIVKNGDAGVGHGILIDTNSHNYTTTNNSVKENVQNGIYVIGCTNGLISGDSTVSNGANGVRVHQKATPVTIENGVALTNNKHGIWVTDTEDANIDGNRALSNGIGADKGSGILVDTNAHNVVINNNTAQQNSLHGIHIYSLNGASVTANDSLYNNAIHGLFVDSVMIGNNPTNTVSTNNAIENGANGIYIRKTNKTNLTSNKAEENTDNGIHVYSSEEARLVTNETFLNGTGADKGSGILVDTNSHQVFTNDNHSYDNELHGIHVLSINDAEITNDRVLTNKGEGLFVDSVKVVSGTDIKITNITATSNQKNGVLIRFTEKANMTNSTLASNTNNGVRVDSLSNEVLLTNNTATANGVNGFYVTNLTTANITSNTADDNTEGIYVSKVDGATIATNDVGLTTGNKANGIRVDTLDGLNDNVSINTNQVNKNALNGIYVLGNNGITSFTGNIIGMDAAKTSVAGLGNGEAGIKVHQSNDAFTITVNFIGGNKNGIHLRNGSNLLITNNRIGTQDLAPAAIDLGNTEYGILMDSVSSDNTVNGVNVIAHNDIAAVFVDGTEDSTVHNRIVSNSMFCNKADDLGGIILSNNGNNEFLKPDISSMSLGVFNDEPNGGADYLVLASNDTTFFKELHGFDIHVYEHDATCDNCRQGQTLVTTLQVDTLLPGYGVAYDLGLTDAVDNATTPIPCGKYTFTVTDDEGNTSEFSTCSSCLEPSCEEVDSEFAGISRDTTICGDLGDIVLTVKDDPKLDDADEIIKWYLDSTGSFVEIGANQNQKTFTVSEPTGNSVRVVYTYQEIGEPACAIVDTVTIHYVKAPSLIVSDDFKLCESEVTTAGSRILIDPNSINNVTGDSLDHYVWTHNGAGNFDADSVNISDPFYLVDATDIGTTVTFNLQAINSVRYPDINVAADSTICFTIDSTYEIEFIKEAEVDAGDDIDVCGGTKLVLKSLVDQAFSDTTSIIWTTTGVGQLEKADNADSASYTADPTEYDPANTTVSFTVEGKSANGCPSATDQVDVTFLNSPTLSLNNVAPVCEDDLATIVMTASGHDVNSVVWSIVPLNGSGTLSGGGNSRDYTPDVADFGDTVQVFVQVKSNNLTSAGTQCEFVRDTAKFVVNIQPTIEIGDDLSLCVGDSVGTEGVNATNDIKASTNNVVKNWTTNIITGATNSVKYLADSSQFFYTAAIADANKTFTVSVETNDNGACPSATDNLQITVNPLPNPDFSGTVGVVCGKGEFEYEVTGYVATSGYTWKAVDDTPGRVTEDNAGNPQTTKFTYANPVSSAYSVKIRLVEEDINSCVDSVEKDVTVEITKSYIVDIIEGTACEGADVTYRSTVTPATGLGNLIYTWTKYDSTNALTQTISSGTQVTSPFNSGDSVLLSVTSDYTCLDTNMVSDAIKVDLIEIPLITLTDDAVICVGFSTELVVNDANNLPNTYTWSAPSPESIGNVTSANVRTAGVYQVTADHQGCKHTSNTVTVTIKDAGIRAIASESVVFQGEEVLITGLGTNGTAAADYTWNWVPTNNTVSQFNDAPDETTTYVAEGTLNGIDGCKAIASVTVKVIKPLTTFNVFTPHEDSGESDGINDVWVVSNVEFYNNVSIKVYNRWGSIVYEFNGDGIDYFNEPWDGTRNGKAVPMAVYYYIVEGEILDIKQKLQGHVSIVR